jgi:hypothetical protein
MKRLVSFVVALLPLIAARPAHAVTVYEDKENDRSVNVGILLQPQLTFTQDGAPSGHDLDTQFFLRRVRIYTGGEIFKGMTFFLQVDQPNLGKGGNFDTSVFFRDAVLSYQFFRPLSIDAGLILWPFTHNSLEGAGSLHTIDYRNPGLLYPATEGKLFSDVGVQLRGLAFNDRLHYRAGAFEGARGPAIPAGAPAGTAPINPKGIPRFMGMVRFNILGVEDQFFFKGVYFADSPLLSIGVGADFQPRALRAPDTSVTDYAAFNGDVFLEYPLNADNEIIANATIADWREGAGSPNTGLSSFGEVGYRYKWIEPVVALDWVHAEQKANDYFDVRPGVNFWFRKHYANLKAEAAWSTDTRPATGTDRQFVVTLQGQAFF